MLSELLLDGFQRHRGLRVQLGPRVTTIMGPTDCGKSSLVRALRWLLLAAPAAAAQPTSGGPVYVEAVVDGRRVGRRQDDSGNAYLLDGEEFRAFRRAMPEPIAAHLGVAETSFQCQHDSAYWLAASAPEVSRQLNQLVNLEIIDTTLGRAAGTVRQHTAQAQEAAENLQECWAAYRQAGRTRGASAAYARLQATQVAADAADEGVAGLREALAQAQAAQAAAQAAARVAAQAAALLATARAAGQAAGRAAACQQAVATARSAEATRATAAGIAEAWGRVRAAAEPYVGATTRTIELRAVVRPAAEAQATVGRMRGCTLRWVEERRAAAAAAQAEASTLGAAVRAAQGAKGEVWDAQQVAAVAQQRLAAVPVCPACGQPRRA